MTNAFILCDLVGKVQKSHAANREGSFNYSPVKSHVTIVKCVMRDHPHGPTQSILHDRWTLIRGKKSTEM